jgi:hypothetical protein
MHHLLLQMVATQLLLHALLAVVAVVEASTTQLVQTVDQLVVVRQTAHKLLSQQFLQPHRHKEITVVARTRAASAVAAVAAQHLRADTADQILVVMGATDCRVPSTKTSKSYARSAVEAAVAEIATRQAMAETAAAVPEVHAVILHQRPEQMVTVAAAVVLVEASRVALAHGVDPEW